MDANNLLNKLGFNESVQKRLAWAQSDRGLLSKRKANTKWRTSEKGRAYQRKENAIRKAVRVIARNQQLSEEPDNAEDEQHEDVEFVKWCETQHAEACKQWELEVKERKHKHSSDYFNKHAA